MRQNKVLVVEDDALVGFEIMAALRKSGLEAVGLLGTVGAALSALKTTKFDAALLNINLYGVPSFIVAKALRRKAIPFAFLTTQSRMSVPPEFHGAPLLDKPFHEQRLLSVALSLLDPKTPH